MPILYSPHFDCQTTSDNCHCFQTRWTNFIFIFVLLFLWPDWLTIKVLPNPTVWLNKQLTLCHFHKGQQANRAYSRKAYKSCLQLYKRKTKFGGVELSCLGFFYAILVSYLMGRLYLKKTQREEKYSLFQYSLVSLGWRIFYWFFYLKELQIFMLWPCMHCDKNLDDDFFLKN